MALYAVLSAALSWPLPLHLATHLTGSPAGDTGVYVWNMWVFHHELVVHETSPLRTGTVMALAPAVDLTLHNYTIFMNALALPLIERLGLVTTFNVVYLALMAFTAWCTAVLVHRLGAGRWEAWLAGVAFAWSPVLVARSTAHFSLVAAAPLPVLLYCLVRGASTGQMRYAVAAGATLAWALFCDVYFAVHGVLLVACWIAARAVSVSREQPAQSLVWRYRALNGTIVLVAAFVTAVAAQGGLTQVFGTRISMRTLYTPVLVLTVLILVRLWLAWRPLLRWQQRPSWAGIGVLLAGLATMVVGMSPVLLAYGARLLDGSVASPDIYWRSSPPGVDLLSFLMPNPNHPLVGGPFRDWITLQRPDGFAELTGSLSVVALSVVVAAWYGTDWRPQRRWLWMPAVFAALALGPFVTVAGLNTYVPGPWAVLRYLPVVGLARSPSRFVVVLSLLVAILFGLALTALTSRRPAMRRPVLALVTLLLLFELSPAPRPLFAGTVPAIFDVIAEDTRPDIRVLALPFGLRDGTTSLGSFNPLTQYQQTRHGKPLVGGYVSRLTAEQKRFHLRFPVLYALISLSEHTALTPEALDRAYASRDRFLTLSNLGYVIVDEAGTSPELKRFATDLLRLRQVGQSDGYSLYVPDPPPPFMDDPAEPGALTGLVDEAVR